MPAGYDNANYGNSHNEDVDERFTQFYFFKVGAKENQDLQQRLFCRAPVDGSVLISPCLLLLQNTAAACFLKK